MDDEGTKNLMCAIVMQTVKDYRSALYRYNTKKRYGRAEISGTGYMDV